MAYQPPASTGPLVRAPMDYARHQPERTLLYQVVEEYYPKFINQLAQSDKTLPQYVQDEFEAYLKCGRLEHGFLRLQCETCAHEQLLAFSCKRRGFCPSCGAKRMVESAALLVDAILPLRAIREWVLSIPYPLRWLFSNEPAALGKALGVVTRAISSYLIKKSGFTHKRAKTGAVTLIQRFGSALNLNVHFHMLFLDGVYVVDSKTKEGVFQSIEAPTLQDLKKVLHKISERMVRLLEREGLLERDMEQSYLTVAGVEDDVMHQLQGSSITYRIAVGPQRGKKVHTLQTLPVQEEQEGVSTNDLVAKEGGFSLHAGVSATAHEQNKIERLCRYISRPAVSTHRLEWVEGGKISYELKTPYRNGTTHVLFEPLDFIARLAALVPKPRVHLTRFHGVFAPNSNYRPMVTSDAKGRKIKSKVTKERCLEEPRRKAMTWSMRLKLVFNIDITICRYCQGVVKVIACIEERQVIDKILAHLNKHQSGNPPTAFLGIRAPPHISMSAA
jgi:ribosomal protein S27E